MRGPWYKSKGNRVIEVSPQLMRYKQLVREKLASETGLVSLAHNLRKLAG
jgi:hypothetical protein